MPDDRTGPTDDHDLLMDFAGALGSVVPLSHVQRTKADRLGGGIGTFNLKVPETPSVPLTHLSPVPRAISTDRWLVWVEHWPYPLPAGRPVLQAKPSG